ncbi:hypothetical protein MLD38_000186 [Melastoma candidum]|uniref:Uncharacterized protein n=1 Tax=Melastoma candidum TaxID=119954 RepID=A0ACB9SD76_9MYRT|nr:hypothetical protein MLD38_000186 [Melastoma candidum]
MKGCQGMKITPWEHPVAGDCGAVIDRTRTEVNPGIPVVASPDSAETLGDGRRERVGVPGGIIVGIRAGLGAKVEEVEVDSRRVGIGLSGALEVRSDEFVDGGVRDGGQ